MKLFLFCQELSRFCQESLSTNTSTVGVPGRHVFHEVAFPFHQVIVFVPFRRKKESRLYDSAQCMTKSNMFIRKHVTY